MRVTVPQGYQKIWFLHLRHAVCVMHVNLKNGNCHYSNTKLQFGWEIMQRRNNPVGIALNSIDIVVSW